MGPHIIDRFASELNNEIDLFNSWRRFQADWCGHGYNRCGHGYILLHLATFYRWTWQMAIVDTTTGVDAFTFHLSRAARLAGAQPL
eukprot:2130954-Pyramimonas_sp.AAC.1